MWTRTTGGRSSWARCRDSKRGRRSLRLNSARASCARTHPRSTARRGRESGSNSLSQVTRETPEISDFATYDSAVPSLTPEQLQEARRRSGRLGGRPPKPTVEEARRAALEELVPPAIKSLKAHLGDGDPEAWRAALRVFEHAFGRPQEQPLAPEDLALPTSAWDAKNLS